MAHEHEHDHEHDHGQLHFQGADVSDATLDALKALHPALGENLALTRRFGELTDEERKPLSELQRQVEQHAGFLPGYHAPGDRCATCGNETTPLFADTFQEGRLEYGAFIANLPVHATEGCLAGFAKARPNLAPRAVDQARRELTKDRDRPSPGMSQFFRHDVLTHPPFGLEDWANSVADANPNLDRPTVKDVERLLGWVHRRLFHH